MNDVSHAIQLALAPVFLLTGIAGMLNVMAGRLARIIDRGRFVDDSPPHSDDAIREASRAELMSLERRRHLASAAITASTLAALLVCTDITVMFVEVMLGFTLSWLVGLLFTAATLALVVGLGYFLREVHMATQTVRISGGYRSTQGQALR